jgi:hypothetical protein
MGLETLSEYGSSQRTGTGTSDRGKLTQWGTAEKKAKDSLHYQRFSQPLFCGGSRLMIKTRASSRGQKLDVQMDRLANCERIYSEKASGATAKDRPELQKALDFVRNEDVFVMTMRDRLARSVVDLANIVKGFR